MRVRVVGLLALIGVLPSALPAQEAHPPAGPKHVAVESTVLTLDQARVRRLGVEGLTVSTTAGSVGGAHGYPGGAVRVGTRVGGLSVSAFLDLVRSERAVRRESTQRIVTLSGSAAELTSQRTVVGVYGQAASAGPTLWVEPVALGGGQVRLRVWTAVGEVRQDRFGGLWEDVPVEARTEITVPSGTPVVIAATDQATERADRELLGRGSTTTATRTWIVVRPRIVDNAAEAFPMPEGVRGEWPKR